MLEHDPEKWIPVFREDHAPPKIRSSSQRLAEPSTAQPCGTGIKRTRASHKAHRVDAESATCSNRGDIRARWKRGIGSKSAKQSPWPACKENSTPGTYGRRRRTARKRIYAARARLPRRSVRDRSTPARAKSAAGNGCKAD